MRIPRASTLFPELRRGLMRQVSIPAVLSFRFNAKSHNKKTNLLKEKAMQNLGKVKSAVRDRLHRSPIALASIRTRVFLLSVVVGTASAGLSSIAITTAHSNPLDALTALVDAAAQRLQTADLVAAAKYVAGNPIEDPKREQQIINTVVEEANASHIDPQYIATIFRDQIDATTSVEYTRVAQWKLNPESAPTVAPDLADLRKTIDGLNRLMMNEIIAQWETLHSPMCMLELDRAMRNVVSTRALDGTYQAALSYATRSYCRQTRK